MCKWTGVCDAHGVTLDVYVGTAVPVGAKWKLAVRTDHGNHQFRGTYTGADIVVHVEGHVLGGDFLSHGAHTVDVILPAIVCPVSTTTTTEARQTTSTTVPRVVRIGTPASPACTEDMACWDCHTMGNHVCGTSASVAAPRELPVTGYSTGDLQIGLLAVLAGLACLGWARRRKAARADRERG